MKNCTTGSRWGRSLMDFLVSLVGRTLLNLKTFLDGTEMMEDSLYEGQIRYIPEEVKEDKNFVEKIVYVSPIRHAEGKTGQEERIKTLTFKYKISTRTYSIDKSNKD